ncbi:hypothetical protein ARMGADRAFT_287971 [Armillaria gallica]|uniref:Uncharacterized protein n=1 Tax=Armillaria gallica TaxID=47427 RepID=A0A2H3DUL3_ARMGA|nr:hypothetical protein ARMGADRAFT_287971 [Armillaria gallica]
MEAGDIAPESKYLNYDSGNEELPSVLAGAVLKSFDYVIEQLNGINVHLIDSLPSIITMQSDVHECFTRLKILFEKTPTPPYPAQSHPHPGPRNPIHLSQK